MNPRYFKHIIAALFLLVATGCNESQAGATGIEGAVGAGMRSSATVPGAAIATATPAPTVNVVQQAPATTGLESAIMQWITYNQQAQEDREKAMAESRARRDATWETWVHRLGLIGMLFLCVGGGCIFAVVYGRVYANHMRANPKEYSLDEFEALVSKRNPTEADAQMATAIAHNLSGRRNANAKIIAGLSIGIGIVVLAVNAI